MHALRAHLEGAERARPWEGAATCASGIRVPAAVGDYLILRAVRESGGSAVAVSEEQIAQYAALIGSLEGAATLAGLLQLRATGQVGPDERVVLFNTGTGLKYPLAPGEE